MLLPQQHIHPDIIIGEDCKRRTRIHWMLRNQSLLKDMLMTLLQLLNKVPQVKDTFRVWLIPQSSTIITIVLTDLALVALITITMAAPTLTQHITPVPQELLTLHYRTSQPTLMPLPVQLPTHLHPPPILAPHSSHHRVSFSPPMEAPTSMCISGITAQQLPL